LYPNKESIDLFVSSFMECVSSLCTFKRIMMQICNSNQDAVKSRVQRDELTGSSATDEDRINDMFCDRASLAFRLVLYDC
jgi:hypothetical protein